MVMRYLGSVTRSGTLKSNQSDVAAASFELECYAMKGDVVHGSGEITTTREAAKLFIGNGEVEFMTDDGHLLKLTLADRKNRPEGGSAHVIATGGLPALRNGLLVWGAAPTPAAE
jgi:hypothetical protein